jgi:hypothetical protein
LAEKRGSVTLRMDAYEDELFETPITVDSVLFTPAPFYVRVWLHEDSNFAVQIERCWATAAQAADSSPSFEFIADGCGVNEVYCVLFTSILLFFSGNNRR